MCIGSTELPAGITSSFQAIEDAPLLQASLGKPDEGKLCQGQVYVSNESADVTLYRAWNSTNPGSKFGSWWAFAEPSGKVSTYRSDYEICYQWSPLDQLVSCKIPPNTRIVVGNGQSAQCSAFLTYPVSATQQVFLENAADVLTDCEDFDGEFSWK